MTDQISIRDLTTQLENRDGHNVSAFFNGKFEEERFKDLDAIRKLNEQDRAAGKTDVLLDCKKEFYYTPNISITAASSAIEKLNGGKLLYSDSLDLHKLTHSDANDLVPALRQPVDLRKLTDALESGDGTALENAFTGKYAEERASILNQVGELNQADLKDHKTTATLEIRVGGSKGSAANLEVGRTMAGNHDLFLGGHELYYERLDPYTGQREVSAYIDPRK